MYPSFQLLWEIQYTYLRLEGSDLIMPRYGTSMGPANTKYRGLSAEEALDCARANPSLGVLDAAELPTVLTIRTWRPGDRFVPLGMSGTQKVHDFFINQKVPRARRSQIPLVLHGEDLIWVGGMRIDEKFRIKSSTREAICLRLGLTEMGEGS